jgi:hypothetical protein
MEVNPDPINTLLANVEQFHKTNLELIKLKTVDKAADVLSTLLSRTFLILTFAILLMTITITASLWLGELLGKPYYGFLAVSLMYSILAAILVITHKTIKSKIADSVIMQILK